MRDELYHYGVKGQKWGRRQYQYENGTWTEEGKRRRRKGPRERVGAYEADLNSKNQNKVSDVDKAVMSKPSSIMTKEAHRLSVVCGLPLKDRPTSMMEDLEEVNKYGRKQWGESWKQNCVKSSYTYVMRRSGLDVTADKVDFLQGLMGGMTYKEISTYIKSKNVEDKQIKHNKNLGNSKERLTEQILKECGNDSRAFGIYVAAGVFGGHAMAWEKIGKKIYFVDPQNGSIKVPNDIFDAANSFYTDSEFSFMRLDNAEFDETKVKNLVRE